MFNLVSFSILLALFALGTAFSSAKKAFTYDAKNIKASKGVYSLSGSSVAYCRYFYGTTAECAIETGLTTAQTSIALDKTTNTFALVAKAAGTYSDSVGILSGVTTSL